MIILKRYFYLLMPSTHSMSTPNFTAQMRENYSIESNYLRIDFQLHKLHGIVCNENDNEILLVTAESTYHDKRYLSQQVIGRRIFGVGAGPPLSLHNDATSNHQPRIERKSHRILQNYTILMQFSRIICLRAIPVEWSKWNISLCKCWAMLFFCQHRQYREQAHFRQIRPIQRDYKIMHSIRCIQKIIVRNVEIYNVSCTTFAYMRFIPGRPNISTGRFQPALEDKTTECSTSRRNPFTLRVPLAKCCSCGKEILWK